VGEDHLKMTLAEASDTRRTLDAIAFKQAQHMDMVRSGAPFSILYSVEENEWNGRRMVQLNIKDIKLGVEVAVADEESSSVVKDLAH
jgi:single-stranded-DNA-specific exonuclease